MGQRFATDPPIRSGFANVRPGIAISAGTSIVTDGDVVFSNSNGVSFGMQLSASSYVITASISGSGVTKAIQSISAGSTSIGSGEVVVLGTQGLSFGVSGQTVTVALPKMNYWCNSAGYQLNGLATASTTLNVSINRESFVLPIDATRLDYVANINQAGSTNGTYTIQFAAYTFAGSTASRVSSASVSVSWDSAAWTNQSGYRYRSVPLGTWSITPGDYLFGHLVSVNGVAGTTASMTMLGGLLAGNSFLEPAGGAHTAYFADGLFNAATSALPASIHLTALNQTESTNQPMGRPHVRLAGTF